MFLGVSMHVTVAVRNDCHKLHLADNATGTDLVEQLDLTPEQAILVVDGSPAPHTERLHDGASVKVVRVASGG